MNGPCVVAAMYPVRKIHDFSGEITLPSCMYRMKNIHAISDNNSSNVSKKSTKNVEILEQRQERILHQLEELKLQLQSIRNNSPIAPLAKPSSGSTVNTSTSETFKTMPFHLEHTQDIVVSANPKYPPLSLKVLCNMLKEHISIGTSCHIHSSLSDFAPQLVRFFQSPAALSRSSHKLIVTLIWKNVEGVDPVMMINPTTQTGIKGEVNIIRYLINLLPRIATNCDPAYLTEMDSILDLLHGSLLHGNNKEIQAVMRQFNTILGKTTWLMGNNLTVIDMVAWSILHQTQSVCSSQGNIKNWLSNCSNHPFFQDVLEYTHYL